MSKAHFWQYVLNTEGQPVSGASISLYTDTTLAEQVVLYETATGSTTKTVITSDDNGYFEFWVGDNSETYGYPTNTAFSLVVFSDSIEARQINDIHLQFPSPRIYSENLINTWVSAGGWGTVYMYNITHNLNTIYPLVQIWNGNKVINDIECYTINSNSVNLSAASDPGNNVHVIIVGNDI